MRRSHRAPFPAFGWALARSDAPGPAPPNGGQARRCSPGVSLPRRSHGSPLPRPLALDLRPIRKEGQCAVAQVFLRVWVLHRPLVPRGGARLGLRVVCQPAMYRPPPSDLPDVVTTIGEDVAVAVVHAMLAELDAGQERCRRRARSMMRWSAALTSIAVGAGAITVLHAVFDKFMGDASWMSLPVILFGIVAATAAGSNLCVRPADRAARWAAAARDFRAAAVSLRHRAEALRPSNDARDAWFDLAASAHAAVRRLTTAGSYASRTSSDTTAMSPSPRASASRTAFLSGRT